MISVRGITKRFGDLTAVSDVSFEVRPREVVGFLGPNGAGKTTTLRILSGYLAPTSGTAKLAGRDVLELNREVRKSIGYLPENNPLYEDMDVSEYLEWAAEVRGFTGAERTHRLRSSVESCGIGEVLAKPIGLLSKGYRQRVGLAAAILHDPEILLLDEPTSGLDPNQTREVRELIQRLKEAKTVLLSTHILPEVEASCDRVVILHRGRVAAEGSPGELIRSAGGAPSIRLTLKAEGLEAGTAAAALRKLPGAAGVELDPGGEEFAASIDTSPGAGDIREDIFRLAVEKGWVILELRRQDASLENVFRELTPS